MIFEQNTPFRSLAVLTLSGFALLAFSSSALAATFTVDPLNGSDASTGTTVRTIQEAYDRAQPGDTISLLKGTHSEWSAPSALNPAVDKPITADTGITATTKYKPLCVFYHKVGTSSTKKITITGPADGSAQINLGNSYTCAFAIRGSWIKIQSLRINGGASTINQTRLNEINTALRNSWEAGDRPANANKANISDAERVVIMQNGIGITGAVGSKNPDPNAALQYNWYSGYWPKNIEIQYVNINGVGRNAIGLYRWADRVTIRNCDLYNNCTRNMSGVSAINLFQLVNDPNEPDNVERIVIESNKIFNNANRMVYENDGTITDGNGFILDTANWVQDGFTANYGGRVTVRNNLFFNNGGAGAAVTKSRRVDIYHNTFYQNVESPQLRNGGTVNGLPGLAPWFEIGVTFSDDCKVKNNVVYGRSDVMFIIQDATTTNSDWGKNILYRTNWNDPNNKAYTKGTAIKSDPLFVDAANQNFKLQTSPKSPAIDVGVSVGVTNDYRNNSPRPIGAGPDLGAFESSYVATSTLSVSRRVF